jgi:hypothetical protein
LRVGKSLHPRPVRHPVAHLKPSPPHPRPASLNTVPTSTEQPAPMPAAGRCRRTPTGTSNRLNQAQWHGVATGNPPRRPGRGREHRAMAWRARPVPGATILALPGSALECENTLRHLDFVRPQRHKPHWYSVSRASTNLAQMAAMQGGHEQRLGGNPHLGAAADGASCTCG